MANVVRSIDVGYGNVKYCKEGFACGSFPAVAKAFTGVNRGAAELAARDMVLVNGGKLDYWVGPDSRDTLGARDGTGGHLVDGYIETPQYLALLRGGLHYIGEPVVDFLVSGLPVEHFGKRRERLRELLVGEHVFPDGRKVEVKDAWVVPQPLGGFIDAVMQSRKAVDLSEVRSLTLDVGYYTLDWVTFRGSVMQDGRSGSVPAGMSMVLEALAELVEQDTGTRLNDLGLLDRGLQRGCQMRVHGEAYDFNHLLPKLDDVVLAAVQPTVKSVGSLADIDLVTVVGGGAWLYQGALGKALGRKVTAVPNSVYSNVRGFMLLGRNRFAEGLGGAQP